MQGLDCIRQRIDVVLRTTKGSSPLRPFFGSDVYKFQDRPSSIAVTGIKAAILDAIGMWMPEISIQKITHELASSFALVFYITYEVVDADITDTIGLAVGAGTITTDASQLVIQGLYPDGYTTHRLSALLVRNGNPVLPLMPDSGFANVDDLFTWIVANWGNYGKWLKGSDRIYLYANKTLFQTGSLNITALAGTVYSCVIPAFNFGQNIVVSLTTPGGMLTSDLFDNIPAMMQWLSNQWGAYGDWSVSGGAWQKGDFGDDFNNDFNTSNYTSQQLNLFSEMDGLSIEVNVTG